MCFEAIFGGGSKGPSAEEQRRQAENDAQRNANAKLAQQKRNRSLLSTGQQAAETTGVTTGKTTTGA